jgi:hypothetical protein
MEQGELKPFALAKVAFAAIARLAKSLQVFKNCLAAF